MLLIFCTLILVSGWSAHAADTTNASTDPSQPSASDVLGLPTNSTGPGNTASCTAPAGNPACAGAGNPINVMTGNKYQREEDLPALPGKLGIEIVRHYNSLHMGLGQIGYGWRLGYEIDLTAGERSIHISQADGSQVIFNRSVFNPSDCACQDPAQGHVMIYHTAQGDEYTWTQLDGQQLHFNHLGKLERITAATGESVHLTRGPKGELLKVTDPQGRSLIMHYADKRLDGKPNLGFKGIIAIDSPVGRFDYQHDNDPKSPGISNLVQVTYPPANDVSTNASLTSHPQNNRLSTTYHYGEAAYVDAHMLPANLNRPQIPQAAHLLTGISLSWQDSTGKTDTQRQKTWMYDQYGRGILSIHGLPETADASDKRLTNTGTQQVKVSYRVLPFKETSHRQTAQQEANISQPYPRITRNGQIGQTTITNSLNQTTIYNYTLIAGQYRLLQILGAGCTECAQPNIVYGYDKLGRQTDVTQVARNPSAPNPSAPDHQEKSSNKTRTQHNPPAYSALSTTHTDFDQSGRVLQVSRIDYRNGKPQAAQLQVRYAYANTPVFPQRNQAQRAVQEPVQVFNQPSLIAKPSVIPGKEHQWRIRYNQYGQPTQITETGYAPAIKHLQDDQQKTEQTTATEITRTISYRYTEINGRSLLTQVDGPLANAFKDQARNSPANSDITQYRYDPLGQYLTRIIAPNNNVTQLSYDREGTAEQGSVAMGGTGRVIKRINSDGIATIYAYNYRGAPTKLTQAGITIQVEYDAKNRAIKYSRNDGASIAMLYDDRTSKVSYLLPDGQKLVKQYDPEDRLTSQHWQDAAGGNLTDPSNIEYAAKTSQPSRVTAPSGLQTVFDYNLDGTLAGTQQGRQITRQQFDPATHLLTLNKNEASYTLQANPENSTLTLTLPNGAQHHQISDDFGRVIVIQQADSGTQLAEYDAADHLIALHQQGGESTTEQRTTYAKYDVSGRLVEQRYVTQLSHTNRADAEEWIRYQYSGTHIVGITSPAQDTAYSYNLLGQVTQQTVTLKSAIDSLIKPVATKVSQTQGLIFSTRYTYDQFGRIQSVTLPEQATLTHRYNKMGQLANIEYQAPANHWWLKAIRWVWRDYGTQTLIANIRTDSAHGLTAFTHNNGLTAQAQFDKAARLVAWQDGQVSNQLTFNAEDKLTNLQKQTPTIAHAQLASQTAPDTQKQQLDYNVYGQLTQIQESTSPTLNANAQLAQAVQTPSNESYQLDLNGNRLSQQAQQPPQLQDNTYQYQAHSDQLLSVKGSHHTQYVYNSLGEPTQILQQNQQTQLNRAIYYGARGQITQIKDNHKLIASYQYNHELQRTHKHTDTQDTYYLWHGGLIDAETQTTAGKTYLSKRYIYLGLKPVALITYDANNQATIYAIHTDYLGTPQAITNATQQVVWRAEYTPFGKTKDLQALPLVTATNTKTNASHQPSFGFINSAQANIAQVSAEDSNNPIHNKENHNTPQPRFEFNLRYAGQYADTETGYHYNWHRYYDPETGRYLTPDPIGLAGGMNAYAYTNHDPMGSVDPWGLFNYLLAPSETYAERSVIYKQMQMDLEQAGVDVKWFGVASQLNTAFDNAPLVPGDPWMNDLGKYLYEKNLKTFNELMESAHSKTCHLGGINLDYTLVSREQNSVQDYINATPPTSFQRVEINSGFSLIGRAFMPAYLVTALANTEVSRGHNYSFWDLQDRIALGETLMDRARGKW